MKIGDRTSNAVIMHILPADEYLKAVAVYGLTDFSQWDGQFPGWREGQIVCLQYDEPQKQGTFEEYWDFRKDAVDFETAEYEYEHLPRFDKMSVPEQAVTIEESNE